MGVPADTTTDNSSWKQGLQGLEPESNIILIPQGSSIQEVLDQSVSGDAIYVEPGIYREALHMDRPGVTLTGLTGPGNEQVILQNPGDAATAIQPGSQSGTSSVSGIVPVGFRSSGSPNNNSTAAHHSRQRMLLDMQREQLEGGIAHYTFLMRVGDGEYDIIRVHRVVAERRPWHPIRTRSNLLMIHGSIQDFDDIFFTAGSPAHTPETSSPVYLASRQIDVWGIDLAWTLIPGGLTDLTFMKDWGIEKDVDHTLKAMAFARLVRALTHQGFGQMNLLGFSYGVRVAYGAAGRETQQHRCRRDIDGLIPADGGMKYATDADEFRVYNCNKAELTKAEWDSGIYADFGGQNFGGLAALAASAPDDPSPVPGFGGLTNKQVLLFLGTSTYLTGNPNAPFWHFVGGDINALSYTDYDRWLWIASSLVAYQPLQTITENNQCYCDVEDVSIDDYLDKIRVPIFYLGAGGGFGEYGIYSTSLTASNDISSHIAHIPGAARAADFGHADLFMGNDAASLAWEPLAVWLLGHP